MHWPRSLARRQDAGNAAQHACGPQPMGRNGGRASAAFLLLNDDTASPASRRLASAHPALAPGFMHGDDYMRIRFLGTNGFYSTTTGNTVCTAIVAKDNVIVLDAGDGFAKVPALTGMGKGNRIDVFLSHLHLDHSAGLHALPKFGKGTEIRIFAASGYIKDLVYLLNHPFTADSRQIAAQVKVLSVEEGINELPYRVVALPLVHADPCLGFSFEIEGKTIAYCTDTGECENIVRLGKGADLLITECSILPGQRPLPHWPHLSPESAAGLAREARAKRLILTHFDADLYTSMIERTKAERKARTIFRNTVAAKDGFSILVS